jgi:hypothetical protein
MSVEGWTLVTDDSTDPRVLEELRARGVITVLTEPDPPTAASE